MYGFIMCDLLCNGFVHFSFSHWFAYWGYTSRDSNGSSVSKWSRWRYFYMHYATWLFTVINLRTCLSTSIIISGINLCRLYRCGSHNSNEKFSTVPQWCWINWNVSILHTRVSFCLYVLSVMCMCTVLVTIKHVQIHYVCHFMTLYASTVYT